LTVILALVLVGPRVFNRVESSDGVPAAAPKVEQKAATVRPEPTRQAPAEEKAPATPATEPAAPPVPKQTALPVVPAPVQVRPQEPAPVDRSVASSSQGIQKVMPEVTSRARNSIQGRVRVTVRVKVDASGRVVGAQLQSAGPSKYFADAALQSARQWKFPAGDGSREWDLQFVFQRAVTNVTPVRVGG